MTGARARRVEQAWGDEAGHAHGPTVSAPRLVGRDGAIRAVETALDAGPAVVLVEGEAGVGKTRLVEELMTDRTISPTVLVVPCPPVRTPVTLGPVLDALRRRVPPAVMEAIDALLRPPPAAAARRNAERDLRDVAAARQRLLSTVADAIGTVGIEIVVVEDAHWADEWTIELLLLLAARLGAGAIEHRVGVNDSAPREATLLVTYRPEDLADGSAMRRLSRHATGTRGVVVPLAALSLSDTGAMISAMLGEAPVASALAELVHSLAGGLPLAIEETVRAMSDRGELVLRDGVWTRRRSGAPAVPTAVRDLVLDRANRLPSDARVALEAIAVLGDPADGPAIAWVSGLPADRLDRALGQGVATGLVIEPAPGRYGVRHVLAAQAVCDAISTAQRTRMHERAASALETTAAPPIGRMVEHYRRAGNVAKWCEYAERGADLAREVGDEATADAAILDVIASDLLPTADVVRLCGKLRFVIADGAGRYDELIRALRAVLRRPDLSGELRAELRFRLGNTLIMAWDYDGGTRELELAVPHLGHDPELATRAMTLLGCPFGTDVPASRHLDWLRRAEAIAPQVTRQSSARAAMLNLDALRALALLSLGEADGWALADSVPTELPANGSVSGVQVARNNLNMGWMALAWGRYAEAFRRLQAGERIALRHGYERTLGTTRLALLHLDWLRGNWALVAERAAAMAEDDDVSAAARLEAEVVLAWTELASGDHESAARRAAAIVADTWRRGQIDIGVEAVAIHARALIRLDRPVAAVEALADAVTLISTKGVWVWAVDVGPAHTDALLAAGRTDDAIDFTHRFAAGAGDHPAASVRAALASSRAALADSCDNPNAGECHAEAVAAWRALPRPYESAIALERYGRWLIATGNVDAAVITMTEAVDVFAALGAVVDRDRVLRSVPVDRPRRAGRPAYHSELSPRERDVLELVAQGRTNREIASALFLSPKTVACHVSSARRKLGVPSRTALAVEALRAGLITISDDHAERVATTRA